MLEVVSSLDLSSPGSLSVLLLLLILLLLLPLSSSSPHSHCSPLPSDHCSWAQISFPGPSSVSPRSAARSTPPRGAGLLAARPLPWSDRVIQVWFETSQPPVDDINHGAARDVDGLIVHKVSHLIFRRIVMQPRVVPGRTTITM